MKKWAISWVVIALLAAPAWAAEESRERQMLRRMQQQLQQTEQARAQAEQEKNTALADKAAAEAELKKLGAAERKLSAEQAARGRVEGDLKSKQSELESLKTRLAETEKKLTDSLALQRATAGKLAQTEQQLAGHRDDLKQCRTHNVSLYTLGREMMQKYHDKSCQDALAQAEPFTGLKQIEVENLMEMWRDQLDRERLAKGVSSDAGTP